MFQSYLHPLEFLSLSILLCINHSLQGVNATNKVKCDLLVGQRTPQVSVSYAIRAEVAAIWIPCLNPGHSRSHLCVLRDEHL